MPRYEFACQDCDITEDFFAPMSEGPPKKVDCPKCTEAMYHVMGGNFILKGGGWPSKDFNKGDRDLVQAREETDAQFEEDNRNQRIVEEVTTTRRKGRKATDSIKSDTPQKWSDYTDAMKKGYRPKEKKSYEITAMKGANISG